MAKKTDDDDGPSPTPEQAQAYAERARAVIALARFDKFCAGLSFDQLTSHPVHQGCITVQALGTSMLAVELGDEVGIGVPPIYAAWIEDFPFNCIAVTATDLFFVTKGFTWLGSEIIPFAVSLGALIPSNLLARLCRQKTLRFFSISGNLATATSGELLRDQRPVPIYAVNDETGVLRTRSYYEKIELSSRTDTASRMNSHFLE